uniref:Uncharacterized protein n=1 Tax=Anguilla anguilla TaxID=7936 RepID=A0A0E9QVM4_ANGAN
MLERKITCVITVMDLVFVLFMHTYLSCLFSS